MVKSEKFFIVNEKLSFQLFLDKEKLSRVDGH